MKRKLLTGLLVASSLLTSQVFAEVGVEKDVATQEIATAILNDVDVTPNFSIENKLTVVGEANTIKVSPMYGVTAKGTFKEIKNESIHVKTDGSFTVLKEGTVKITPEFTLSPESLKEITQAYIKENNLVNVTENDFTSSVKEIAQILTIEGVVVQETQKVAIDITPTFEINKEELAVGETAQLSVKPIEGVEVTGTFSNGNEFVKIADDGTVTGIKASEKEMFIPFFKLSEKSHNDIFEAYKKKPGNENLVIDDVEFITRDIAQLIPIKITPIQIGLSASAEITKAKIEVGETTKLYLQTIEGVQLVGIYPTFKDEIVELKADGTVTGFKVGRSSIPVSDYTVSDESMKELIAVYNKKLGIDTLTKDDFTFIRPSLAVKLEVEVVAKTVTSTSTTKTNTSTAKTLPKTGETQTSITLLFGLVIVTSSLLILKKKKKAD